MVAAAGRCLKLPWALCFLGVAVSVFALILLIVPRVIGPLLNNAVLGGLRFVVLSLFIGLKLPAPDLRDLSLLRPVHRASCN